MDAPPLKEYLIRHVLPRVRMPAQYLGGEWNMVRKDPREGRGRLCLAFPDAYTIGLSHHGLQLLYALMNARDDWYCERAFAPLLDVEQALRSADLPLFSLETFTPLNEFDVVGFSLQYELAYGNVLNMLDLGRIPLHAADRTMRHPLVVAGGPCGQNPEPLAPFIDVFILGDGEISLPEVCGRWKQRQDQLGSPAGGRAGRQQRAEAVEELAAQSPYVYAPRFYQPQYRDGRLAGYCRSSDRVPEVIQPAVVADLDAVPLPTRPVVPFVESVHDRIAIEIMRGCPWTCRFCQSTVIKRPFRVRSVATIVNAAWETYRQTGFNEISLLSLSSSDYPHFEALVTELQRIFRPLGVNISVPSLRVNAQLRTLARLIGNDRRSGLTLAPEVACDDMREQIRKKIKNEDLYEGCRVAFENQYERVKLYFMCGLPGERPEDLEGIVHMAETIARIGKQQRGRFPQVTASVSNFVPKPHTPFQWNAMQRREYFQESHAYLRRQRRLRCVRIQCHSVETSLLEGLLSRGDRRMAEVIELVWRRGGRMDSWSEHFCPSRWWHAVADTRLDIERILHQAYPIDRPLPWDLIGVRPGREFLEREQARAAEQLALRAERPLTHPLT